jgi:hypothetical protein
MSVVTTLRKGNHPERQHMAGGTTTMRGGYLYFRGKKP